MFTMSLDDMIPQESMEGVEGMGEDASIEISQTDMILPPTLTVGDELADATIKMSVSMSGMNVMSMTINITDRKVDKAEEVTTDAGTFSCMLVSYKTTADMGFVQTESSSKEWYSPLVGVVKGETYDKDGKLESKRLLTKFTPGS